ncbi:hypothetical protein LOTGIDRAFT_233073 [Lottia gigantea]|uniref:KIAA1045 RING finger domain-containing protein n=1 Tax=Lottia gigantea TaxID=225164 RepID=V4AGU6_LOTGI|nr:hypothetical protein LOTGIDRAFT_233073 [Lottia gigantea]ESO92631.1 hypothetical protein LOTGIDRAFT_233073 [Lottia gigantea]
MGNRASRNKSQKSHKGSKKDDNQTLRTRSLNSLPLGERLPSKPKPMSQSVRERKCVVSERCLDTEVSNATRHRRQNTAPEIIVQSTPRSLKISDFSKVIQQPDPPQEEVDFNIPIENALEPTPDELCQICSVFTGKIKFLCKICYQVYHLGCLQKIEQHEPSPVVCYLNRADTELGWSCHSCVSNR